jgi:S-layer homology domain
MPKVSVRLFTLHRRFPIPIPRSLPIPIVLLCWGLSGCANTDWGERIEQSFSIPSPVFTGETPNPTLQGTPRPEVTAPPTAQPLTDQIPNPAETIGPDSSPNPNLNNTEEPQSISPSPSPLAPLGETIGPTLPSIVASPPSTGTNPNVTVPESLAAAVEPVLALGVLSVPTTPTRVWEKPVSRRQFARWLFAVNNRLYADRPGQQIRATSTTVTPIFRDIPSTDPDFTLIQGLAEAGILPSPLRGNATVTQFRPDAPLTREQMVLWKVPLDARQSLPTATIDRITQTWNFQDSSQISGEALGAVLLDFQNGELSNIRRVFGYTTLFQPQKPVTQGEAIVALGYFGFQGQGVSASNPPSP